jgi:hypothetical protein
VILSCNLLLIKWVPAWKAIIFLDVKDQRVEVPAQVEDVGAKNLEIKVGLF